MERDARFEAARRNWERLGRLDPMWAILTEPERRGAWDAGAFLATGERQVEHELGRLEALGVAVRRGSVLDFGCGLGRLTLPLAARFESALGVDVAEAMVRGARELAAGQANVRYVHNTAPDLRCLDPGGFDFILSLITLQHVPPRAALAYVGEFVRLLAPGGVALFQLPERYHGLWPAVRRRLPAPVLPALWRLMRRTPYMEMNETPRAQVERAVRDAGGSLLHVLPDTMAGPRWTSWKYVVTRAG